MKSVPAALIASLVGSAAGAGIAFGVCYQVFSADLKQIDRRLDELGDRLQSQRNSGADPKFGASGSAHVDVMELRAELSKLVQAELDARAVRPSVAPSPTAAVNEPAPESVAASQRALQLIDGAVSAGQWTDENRMELRRLLGQMTEPQRREATTKLAQALNAGKIPVHGPVF